MGEAAAVSGIAGTLRPMLAVASLAFRESARNRILHSLVVATLLACGSSYLFAYVSGGDNEALRHSKVVLDLSLSSISLLGTIAVIFLGTNLIYQEVERRTIYTILARPISRTGFIIGKYLGLAAVMAVAVTLMGIGFAILYAAGGNGLPSAKLVLALVFIYVELLVVLAVALFFSVAAHPIEGAVFAFVVTIAGHVTESLNDLGTHLVTRAEDPGIFHVALQKFLYVIYVVFPNLENFNLKAVATYDLPVDPAGLAASVGYAVVYIAILLALSSLVFRRRVL